MHDSAPTHFETGGGYAINVTLETPYSDDARRLIDHLWEELDRRYGPNPRTRFTPEQIDVPGAFFLIARIDGRAVGCGALLPLEPGVGEIKRMWVEPDWRRKGVAQAVLEAIQQLALLRDLHTLRLETGNRQPEAIALYERLGFIPCDCWGSYVGDPISRCYEKAIRTT